MSVISYRIYCDDCTRDTVIRERFIESTSHPWKVNNKYNHSGLCPVCNPVIDEDDSEFDDSDIELELESLRGIGSKTAERLRENDIVTKKDVRSVTIKELQDIKGMGKTSIESLKNAV